MTQDKAQRVDLGGFGAGEILSDTQKDRFSNHDGIPNGKMAIEHGFVAPRAKK